MCGLLVEIIGVVGALKCLGITTYILVENIGSRNNQICKQISGSTLISCVTLDKTHFLSELQKTGVIIVH